MAGRAGGEADQAARRARPRNRHRRRGRCGRGLLQDARSQRVVGARSLQADGQRQRAGTLAERLQIRH
eukprot:6460968-Prymnesium_polylepis.1